MTTKEYFNRLDYLELRIQNKLWEICRLRALASGTSSMEYKERVQTSANTDKIGDIVSLIVEEEEAADALIDEMVALKESVKQRIARMDKEKHREIIFKRYIERKSIHTIAQELGMTDRGCKKAHSKAIKEFESN